MHKEVKYDQKLITASFDIHPGRHEDDEDDEDDKDICEKISIHVTYINNGYEIIYNEELLPGYKSISISNQWNRITEYKFYTKNMNSVVDFVMFSIESKWLNDNVSLLDFTVCGPKEENGYIPCLSVCPLKSEAENEVKRILRICTDVYINSYTDSTVLF